METVKCDNCGKIFQRYSSWLGYSKSGLHFCCNQCRGQYSRRISDYNRVYDDRRCRMCNCFIDDCDDDIRRFICRIQALYNHRSIFWKIVSKLNLTNNDFVTNIRLIRMLLFNLYITQRKSIVDILKLLQLKPTMTVQLANLLNAFNIQIRSLSEAKFNADLNHPPHKPAYSRYKCGYHTSWEGITFYYRSSYELAYANQLDEQKISYRVESLRIPYFNTITNKQSVAIPDFYLPDANTIVEIKSNYTYNKQNMIDKVAAYKQLGYNFELILEGEHCVVGAM